MKHTVTLDWLKKSNLDSMNAMKRTLYKADPSVGDDEEELGEILDGKLKNFYPAMNCAIIKFDDKKVGMIGYYNSFTDKKDMWIGWFSLLKAFKNKKIEKYALLLIEKYIIKHYPTIDHLHFYASESNRQGMCLLFGENGYFKESKRFEKYGIKDFAVFTKCVKGDFRHWNKKPVW